MHLGGLLACTGRMNGWIHLYFCLSMYLYMYIYIYTHMYCMYIFVYNTCSTMSDGLGACVPGHGMGAPWTGQEPDQAKE